MQFPLSSANPLILSLLTSLLLATSVTQAQPADWEIDPEHFSIAFGAGHIGFQQQLGMFLEASGSFRYDPATRELISGRVEVKADSIFTDHDDRDDHLRGRDFLNARRHPVIAFEATKWTPSGEDERRGTLTGNLTMLEETHPVELDVTINKQDRYPFGHRSETLGISANTTILRSRWGMDYGVADNLVGDEVSLRFEFEALRQ
ncbi:MAG: YceI family protein [Pseudohongiellaceae bacterium]